MTPASVQLFTIVLSITTTLIVGLLAAFIAFRQMVTSQQQLKLSLFERRYKIYEGAMSLVDHKNIKDNSDGILREFDKEINGGEFLFPDEINLFLQQLRQKVRAFASEPHSMDALIHWSINEQSSIRKTFRPYLDFAEIK